MTKILKKVKLNAPASTSTGVDPTKGTQTNPYTQEEFFYLLDLECWPGGWVEGMGYVITNILITGSTSEEGLWGWDVQDLSGNFLNHFGEYFGGTGGGNSGGTGGGNNTLMALKETRKANAMCRILEYQSQVGPTNPFFVNFSKSEFLTALQNHILNPSSVQQGLNGTCGAAVICKFLAEFLPDQYVEAAISLFETGSYNEWELTMAPDSSIGTQKQLQNLNITLVDAIMQGAIISSCNYCLTYNPFTDGSGTHSFAWPQEIYYFFTQTLHLRADYSFFVSFDDLIDMDYSNNYIIAAVYLEQIRYREYTAIYYKPDHYIQLLEKNGEGTNKKIKFWQWGSDNWYLTGGIASYVLKIY